MRRIIAVGYWWAVPEAGKKMKPGNVETKEESEDDIMMYDSYSRVICRQWKTDKGRFC